MGGAPRGRTKGARPYGPHRRRSSRPTRPIRSSRATADWFTLLRYGAAQSPQFFQRVATALHVRLPYRHAKARDGLRAPAVKRPEIPCDEQARLQTLRALNVLDTAPEERFDRLTRMAKRLFGVPIAVVSLVDEHRQWFKSCVGLDGTEASREFSFCGHAILGDDVFIVSNASQDERFADNPNVLNDPYIRFYAGCPLKAENGHKLGTLCIVDRQPRDFSADDMEALKDLAAMAERELAAIQLATLDELTGISNRRGFMLLGQHSLHFCVRHKLPASLVFMDLDKFKSINDTYGHAEGDRALKVFADSMKRVYRDSDTFARLGGDEFVVLLSNTSQAVAEGVVARFGAVLSGHNQDPAGQYPISFSHGIVGFDRDRHRSIDMLLADGDAIMYRLKKSKPRS